MACVEVGNGDPIVLGGAPLKIISVYDVADQLIAQHQEGTHAA
jgi:hypothetical protein